MVGHFSVLGQHEVKPASFASWVGELQRIVQFCPSALVKGNRCSWLFIDVNICFGLCFSRKAFKASSLKCSYSRVKCVT